MTAANQKAQSVEASETSTNPKCNGADSTAILQAALWEAVAVIIDKASESQDSKSYRLIAYDNFYSLDVRE